MFGKKTGPESIAIFLIILSTPFLGRFSLLRENQALQNGFEMNISAAQILAGLAGIFFLGSDFVKRAPMAFGNGFPMLAAFIGAIFLSHPQSFDLRVFPREVAQVFALLLVPYLALHRLIRADAEGRGKDAAIESGIAILFVSNMLLALYQRFIIKSDPFFVKGFFENSHYFGGMVVIAFPVIIRKTVYAKGKVEKSLYVLMGFLAGLSLGYIWAIICVFSVIALLLFGTIKEEKRFVLAHSMAFCLATALSFYADASIGDEVFRGQNIPVEFARVKSLIAAEQNEKTAFGLLGGRVAMSSAPTIQEGTGTGFADPEEGAYSFYKEGDVLNQRVSQWLASMNMGAVSPMFGMGWGSFRKEIGGYYFGLPKINTLEPDSENTFLFLFATTGFAGLGAFFWLLYGHLYSKTAERRTAGPSIYFYSLVGMMIYGIFFQLLTAGFCVLFSLTLLLSAEGRAPWRRSSHSEPGSFAIEPIIR